MIRRLSNAALCLSLCFALGACTASEDKHTFQSTTYSPKTVRVVDATSDEVLYEWEGEPGTEVTLKLDSEDGGGVLRKDRGPATTLKYTERDSQTKNVTDSGEMELVGEPSIQLIARPVRHLQSSPRTTTMSEPGADDQPEAPTSETPAVEDPAVDAPAVQEPESEEPTAQTPAADEPAEPADEVEVPDFEDEIK